MPAYQHLYMAQPVRGWMLKTSLDSVAAYDLFNLAGKGLQMSSYLVWKSSLQEYSRAHLPSVPSLP
jgi:hypothetical protein